MKSILGGQFAAERGGQFVRKFHIYFQDIHIRLLRESRRPDTAEFEILRKESLDYAIIQTEPNTLVLRNFISDAITLNFVNAFKELGCTFLYNKNGFAKLDYYKGKEKIIIFRGSHHEFIDTLNAIHLDDNWKYIRRPHISSN